MIEDGSVDDNENLDTNLYRSRPRRKGEGWEDNDEGNESIPRGKDPEEMDRQLRSKIIQEELARRRSTIESNSIKVCLFSHMTQKTVLIFDLEYSTYDNTRPDITYAH